MKRLLAVGSTSAVENLDTVFTSFKFTLNKYMVYKKSFEECKKTYNCHKHFVTEATIRNAIHNNIWTNKTTKHK